jgi:Zinc knuckle
MAHIQRPFNEEDPTALVPVERRTEDNLPERVKGIILWKTDLPDREPEYYIYNVQNNTHSSVEFIEVHWYWLYDHSGFTFVSLQDHIEHYTFGTGYWAVKVDPQHPQHHLYLEEQIRNTEWLGLQLVLPEGYEAGPSGAPALTVDTGVPTLSEDPTLSAFVAPALATATVVSSPAFTQSRHQSDQEESDSPGAQNNDSTTDEPSPEQLGQEEPVLEAQLAYGLDVQDRKLENPLTPEQPAYQGLIEDAVQAGLNVPPPPPLVQPVAPQFPAPQPIAPAPAMAAAAQVPTHLVGNTLDIFNGDRTMAEDFKLQFQLHQALNNTNRIMAKPYYRTLYALSLIKGPLVKDWVKEQVSALIEKTTHAVDWVGMDEDRLWNEYATTFDAAFTDTTKKQQVFNTFQHLHMNKDDLDTYVTTFKHLAKVAGSTLNEPGTTYLFALGLKQGLMDAILHRNTQPVTLDDWITQAQTEQWKFVQWQAMKNPHAMRFAWLQPQSHRNGHGCHPNDQTVPMDVDPPVFTQVRHAYTEAQKDQYKKEGRCFECDKQGHMARECPNKKTQAFKRPYQPDRQFRSNQRPPFQGDSRFKKKPFGQYNQQKPFNQPKRTKDLESITNPGTLCKHM